MPNWCFNNVHVYGEKATLVDFSNSILDTTDDKRGFTVWDLSKLHPTPPELCIDSVYFPDDSTDPKHIELRNKYALNIAKYGVRDWYEWNVQNWGTKWSPEITVLWISDDGQLKMSFDSAWSPPTGLIAKASEKYPTLIFSNTYSEEGMEFWGCEVFQNGELISECAYDYGNLPEAFANRYKSVDSLVDEENDDWSAVYEARARISDDLLEHCETTALRTLRYAGILPFAKN